MKSIIKNRLSHVSPDERKDAVAMLLLAGLKHYSLLYPENKITMSALRIMAGIESDAT